MHLNTHRGHDRSGSLWCVETHTNTRVRDHASPFGKRNQQRIFANEGSKVSIITTFPMQPLDTPPQGCSVPSVDSLHSKDPLWLSSNTTSASLLSCILQRRSYTRPAQRGPSVCQSWRGWENRLSCFFIVQLCRKNASNCTTFISVSERKQITHTASNTHEEKTHTNTHSL